MSQIGKFRISTYNGETTAVFFCPGCDEPHAIRVKGPGAWGFNGNFDVPTFTPSILVRSKKNCHSYITDGKIQFLGDCKHRLRGQTVPLPDLPQWLKD